MIVYCTCTYIFRLQRNAFSKTYLHLSFLICTSTAVPKKKSKFNQSHDFQIIKVLVKKLSFRIQLQQVPVNSNSQGQQNSPFHKDNHFYFTLQQFYIPINQKNKILCTVTPLKAIQCVPIYISKSTKHHPQSYILKACKEASINANNKKCLPQQTCSCLQLNTTISHEKIQNAYLLQ